MLVVERTQGQEIIIRDESGNYIGRVRVARITGDRTSIGVELPQRYIIHRREIDAKAFPGRSQPTQPRPTHPGTHRGAR